MIKISIRFVDDGYEEYSEPDSFFRQYQELKCQGYEGKALVHELLTDDWGAPPLFVNLSGKLEDGTDIDETISYG